MKQEINRAVNLCFEEHEGCQFAYEQLSVASMRFKARSMNAYMRASNLAHIPRANQLECHQTRGASNEGQECVFFSAVSCVLLCRPQKQAEPAHVSAARSAVTRRTLTPTPRRILPCVCMMRSCAPAQTEQRSKHCSYDDMSMWKQKFRLTVVEPPVQLRLWASSKSSTDVG